MTLDDSVGNGQTQTNTAAGLGGEEGFQATQTHVLAHADPVITDLKQYMIRVEARAWVTGKTGVEMEALVAVSAAALTVYDMCKSMDRSIEIDAVRLIRKSGGRSGEYEAPPRGS